MSLLLPVSTIESPKTISAGTVSFLGNLAVQPQPLQLWKMLNRTIKKIMIEEQERGFEVGNFIVL